MLFSIILIGCRRDYDCICTKSDGGQEKKFTYYNSKKTIAEVSCNQWLMTKVACADPNCIEWIMNYKSCEIVEK